LILPVVICLSQRLSHACLSMNWFKVKPRIAHYNSRRFLDLRYTWITVVILELIHAIELRPYGTSAFIRTKPISGNTVVWWLWITTQIASVLYRQCIFQVSALSTFDGSLCAYHGCNG